MLTKKQLKSIVNHVFSLTDGEPLDGDETVQIKEALDLANGNTCEDWCDEHAEEIEGG